MLKELVKISTLDDIQNVKHRHNGLWAIGSIFRALEEILHLHKTNFVLANNPSSYRFIDELNELIELNDKFLKLEISDVTPANVLMIYDLADNLRMNMLQSLTCGETIVGFLASKQTTIELLPAIEVLVYAYRELLDQSRHNLLASMSSGCLGNQDEQDTNTIQQIRELCCKLQNMQLHEIKANLTSSVFEFLKLAKQLDPTIKSSLAFQNQGL